MSAERHSYVEDEQFLRKAFDFAEQTDFNEAGRTIWYRLRHMDRRLKILLLTTIASILMLWVAAGLLQILGNAIEVANRPSLDERLAAPYDVAARLVPDVDVSLYLIMPTQVADLELQNTYVPALTLLSGCLNSAMNPEQRATQNIKLADAPCSLDHDAVYSEWASFQVPGATDNASALDALNANNLAAAELGNAVNVSLAQFASQDEAAQVMRNLFDYSRTIGRTGNYVLVTSQANEYFYSSTRGAFSFTWSNGSYIYSVTAPSFDQMEQTVKAFPY